MNFLLVNYVPLSVMMEFGTLKRWMMSRKNSIACSDLIMEMGRASIHFVNLSIVTSKWEYFYDDVRPVLGCKELVAVLVALHEAENKVPDVEGSVPHPSAVVSSQRLLVLGRMEEGDVAGFI